MEKTTAAGKLDARILMLKAQQKQERVVLKEQLLLTYDSLKPANLLKQTIEELAGDPVLKGNLADTALGLAAGHLSKRIITGPDGNTLRQILGSVLEMAVTSTVLKNGETIRSGITRLTDLLFNKQNTPKN